MLKPAVGPLARLQPEWSHAGQRGLPASMSDLHFAVGALAVGPAQRRYLPPQFTAPPCAARVHIYASLWLSNVRSQTVLVGAMPLSCTPAWHEQASLSPSTLRSPYSSSPQATPHLQLVLTLISQQDHEANSTQLLLDVTLLEQMRRLALGSKPRLVDRGRVLVRPERLLHVLAAAAAAVAAAAATSLTRRRACRV